MKSCLKCIFHTGNAVCAIARFVAEKSGAERDPLRYFYCSRFVKRPRPQ